MSGSVGRSLELYYIEGRPDGMLTAELFNWSGHVLVTPRTRLSIALARPEAGYTGVYLLLGEQDGQPYAYLGESDDISERIRKHDSKKEWWDSAIMVTTSANKLNKAHVRYLEARLIQMARLIKHVPLDNKIFPPIPLLSESDIAKMEVFLENLLVILPAIRVDMFIERARPAGSTRINATIRSEIASSTGAALSTAPNRFLLVYPAQNIRASAILKAGEFIVEAGSQARNEWNGQPAHNYAGLYAELVESGVLVPQDNHRRFAQDYAFSSPSAAAAIVYGRSASGPSSWHLEGENISYKDWEARQLESIPESDLELDDDELKPEEA